MKKLVLFTLCAFLFLMCDNNNSSKDAQQQTSPEDSTSQQEAIQKPTTQVRCFLNTFEGEPMVYEGDTLQRMIDSTQLKLSITKDNVEGIFNYLPAEKDARIGTFNGTIGKDGRIEAIYVYFQEGETHNEGLIIELHDQKALVKLVEIDLAKGELQVQDNPDIAFEEIQRVDCH